MSSSRIQSLFSVWYLCRYAIWSSTFPLNYSAHFHKEYQDPQAPAYIYFTYEPICRVGIEKQTQRSKEKVETQRTDLWTHRGGVGGGQWVEEKMGWTESSTDTHTHTHTHTHVTMCKIQCSWEAAVCSAGCSAMTQRGRMGGGGRDAPEGGVIYILIVNSRCCTAETQHCKTIILQLKILKLKITSL